MPTLAVAVRREHGAALFNYARDYELFLSRVLAASDHCSIHQLTVLPRGLVMVATPSHGRGLSAFLDQTLGEQVVAGVEIETKEIDPSRLGRVTIYNDNLPYRLGRVPDPARYKWSTAALHAGQGIAPSWWCPSAWYIALAPSARERALAYADTLARFRTSRKGRRDIPCPVELEPPAEGTEIGKARLPFRIV